MPTTLLALAVTVLLFVLCKTPALAVTEYCSAQLDVWPSSPEPTSEYLAVLWADDQHPVIGKVFFYTKQGWFVAPIGEVALNPSVSTTRTARFTNHHDAFRSERYAVHFPSNVDVDDVVFASSDGTLCPAQESKKIETTAVRYGWKPFPDELTRPPYVLAASPTTGPGETNCKDPFKPASATAAFAPNVPRVVMEEGVDRSAAIIDLAIDADGSLKDAWVFSSSGFSFFDQEVLRAARLSKYTAARSFCRSAPGNFLYRGEFQLE